MFFNENFYKPNGNHLRQPPSHPFTKPVIPETFGFAFSASNEGNVMWFSAKSKNNGLQGIGRNSGGKWAKYEEPLSIWLSS